MKLKILLVGCCNEQYFCLILLWSKNPKSHSDGQQMCAVVVIFLMAHLCYFVQNTRLVA